MNSEYVDAVVGAIREDLLAAAALIADYGDADFALSMVGRSCAEVKRILEEAGHEFHGNQWSTHFSAHFSAHPSEPLAKNGYLTNPLHQEGGPSSSPAWTGAKDKIEGSLAGQSFGEMVAHGSPETVSIDSLNSYQTWTRKDSLEHHAARFDSWKDQPAAIIYRHDGKDWIVDGNNRLSMLKSCGETQAKVLRISKISYPRAASEFVSMGGHLFSRLPEEWFSEPNSFEALEHSYSSTQIDLPEPLRTEVINYPIDHNDIVERELTPHVTVKYGLHTSNPDEVAAILEHVGLVRVVLGVVGMFDGDESDVLKIDVFSPDLVRLNALLSNNLEHTDTHPDYHPHVTLAYVVPGSGAKYVGDATFAGLEFVADTIAFSDVDDRVVEIKTLAGGRGPEAERDERGRYGPGGSKLKLSGITTRWDEWENEGGWDDSYLSLNVRGRKVGGASVTDTGSTLFVKYIEVDLPERGKGYGKLLATELIHTANERGLTTISGESDSASWRGVLDKMLGAPEIQGDPNYLKNETEGVDVVHTIPEHMRSLSGGRGPEAERDSRGQYGSGESSKADVARAAYVPCKRDKQQTARNGEQEVALALNGKDLRNNEPMDVIVKTEKHTHGVEVKTLVNTKNDNITMHRDAIVRKEKWVKSNHAIGHTVIVDKRSEPTTYYYKKGFGAFRLGSMKLVTLDQLRGIMR